MKWVSGRAEGSAGEISLIFPEKRKASGEGKGGGGGMVGEMLFSLNALIHAGNILQSAVQHSKEKEMPRYAQ